MCPRPYTTHGPWTSCHLLTQPTTFPCPMPQHSGRPALYCPTLWTGGDGFQFVGGEPFYRKTCYLPLPYCDSHCESITTLPCYYQLLYPSFYLFCPRTMDNSGQTNEKGTVPAFFVMPCIPVGWWKEGLFWVLLIVLPTHIPS